MHQYVPGPRAGLSPNEPLKPLLGRTEGLFTSTHEPEPHPFWRFQGLGPQIQKERLQGSGEWAPRSTLPPQMSSPSPHMFI